MAETGIGPVCPGCTPAAITAKIERAAQFGMDMVACRTCRDRGALFHAQRQSQRDERNAQIMHRRKGGQHMEESHGQG